MAKSKKSTKKNSINRSKSPRITPQIESAPITHFTDNNYNTPNPVPSKKRQI